MRTSVLLGASFMASAALSQGIAPDKRRSQEDVKLRANFRLYSEYAFAAYCPASTDGQAGHALCSTQACLDLAPTTTTYKEFQSGDLPGLGKYGISGYVATDPKQKTVVVVFRGTQSLKDVLVDLFFTMRSSAFGGEEALCKDCQLHNGFRRAFDSVRQDILDAVNDLKSKSKYEKVVVTGHSLGGAVATIASAYLRKQGHNCDLYTYGSPRVGNRQFARFVEGQQKGQNYRIANQNDAVVAIPIAGLGRFPFFLRNRYDHIFPEYWYKNGLSKTGNPYDAEYDLNRENKHNTCIKDNSLFGISAPLDALACKVKHHQVYANADPDADQATFKPCDSAEGRGGDDDSVEEELSPAESQHLNKILKNNVLITRQAVKKECQNSCKGQDPGACEPVSIKQSLQDESKCQCLVRLGGHDSGRTEYRDEIRC